MATCYMRQVSVCPHAIAGQGRCVPRFAKHAILLGTPQEEETPPVEVLQCILARRDSLDAVTL